MPTTSTTYNLGPCDCCGSGPCDCDCPYCEPPNSGTCGYYSQFDITTTGWTNGIHCPTCPNCQTTLGGTWRLYYVGFVGSICYWQTNETMPVTGPCSAFWTDGFPKYQLQFFTSFAENPGKKTRLRTGASTTSWYDTAYSCSGKTMTSVQLNPVVRCCELTPGTSVTLSPVAGTWVDCGSGSSPPFGAVMVNGVEVEGPPRPKPLRKPVVIKMVVNGAEVETTWDGKSPMTFTVPGEAKVTRVEEVKPIPCEYVGDELTAAERRIAGVDHLRRWTRCQHPARASLVGESRRKGLAVLASLHATGRPVCPCKGCGVDCPGYVPDKDQSDVP